MAHNPTVQEIPALRGSRGLFYGWFVVAAAFAVTFVDFGWRRAKSMLSPVIRFFQSWKRYGLAVQELSQLSDRELADIGITRSDIPRIAWEQSHQA